jgi:Ca2+-transporting ATPase
MNEAKPLTLDGQALDDLFAGVFANHGTLRHLFLALCVSPNRVIQGSAWRTALDKHNLRRLFDDLFQTPLVVETLDSVTTGQQARQPTLAFHFAQPQTLSQRTPIGAIKLLLGRTLLFTVDERGDVALRRGDIQVRWFLLREDLLLRLRQSQSADGAPEDVVQISAANILTRTLPLEPLVAPPLLSIAPVLPVVSAPPAAPPVAGELSPPVPVVAAAVAVDLTGIVVVHQTPGRLRLHVVGLYRNEKQKGQLEQGLRLLPGVQRVAANVLTGTVLVAFDLSLSTEAITLQIGRIRQGLPLQTAQPAEQWHLLDLARIGQTLATNLEHGLDVQAIEVRRQRYGVNALPAAESRSAFAIFADQLKSLPVLMLGGSALLSLFTGGVADAVVILGVVFINAGIGYTTESKAEKTISALTRGLRPTALVLRAGVEVEIQGEELVPGDLLLLKRGMYVPADVRLLEADRLTIDESALTGESVPVQKSPDTLTERDIPLGSRVNMAYRGTVVTGGSGRAIVVTTGVATEIGLIQRLLAETQQPETPLQRQLRVLSSQLVLGTLALCSGVFAIGLLRGNGFLPMLRTAVSLAVAAVPEGLPTVATTTLALGLRRLQQQQVLVRKLAAVETLGALQVVCLDKTGTITRNRMTLVALHVEMTLYRIDGAALWLGSERVNGPTPAALAKLLELTALCSEVEIDATPAQPQLKGTPTESALVQAALDLGVDAVALRREHPLLRTRLRSEQRSFMDTLHNGANGEQLLAVKGRPAEVLAMCDRQVRAGLVQPLTQEDRLTITTENERMAGRALRVIGVAYLPADSEPDRQNNLIWVGLAGIADPPRQGMTELMGHFHHAGIHTTMITGDQSATAYAIAREIGLSRNGELEILDSNRLDELAPDLLRSLAQRVDVFSRVSPAHKLKIVQALQHAGYVVAMTGDGVNDGPALRAADIGIAMGQDGSEVAQEVADIIIRDDNLATIISAVEQGRTIYADIRKAVHFILSSNISEIMVTLTATSLGLGEPLSPVQLLWINLVTDIFPELALSIDPPEADVMDRPPRPSQAPMFSQRDLKQIGLEGTLITASTMAAYSWGLLRYGMGPRAGTMAFTSLTAAQLLHSLNCRSGKYSIWDQQGLAPNPYMPLAVGGGLTLQLLATYLPGLRTLVGATPLGPLDLAVTTVAAGVPFLVGELVKLVERPHRTEGNPYE